MSWHPEVLAAEQEQVLRQSAQLLAKNGFLLGGGTALALTFGHRKSLDFDWFKTSRLDDPLQLAAELTSDGLELQMTGLTGGRFTLAFTVCRSACSSTPTAMLIESPIWRVAAMTGTA